MPLIFDGVASPVVIPHGLLDTGVVGPIPAGPISLGPRAASAPRIAAVAALAAILFACQAAPPSGTGLDSEVPPDSAVLDIPPGCPATPQLAAPVLDPFPDPTANALQAFRGRAEGAAMITARGSAGNAAPQEVGADGAFCLEVRLIEDAQNSITFTSLDDRGCPGETKVVSLRHESVARSDAAVSAITNVALKAPAKSAPVPDDDGVLAYVNDGNPSTSVKLSFWDWDVPDNGRCDAYAWIQIDFGKPYTISQINLRWKTGGAPYATCYAVLLSAASAPGEPSTTSADWTVAEQKQDGDAAAQELKIDPEVARHAAVLLYENASSGVSEDFEVAEIEVLGQDPNAMPPPPPDRCE